MEGWTRMLHPDGFMNPLTDLRLEFLELAIVVGAIWLLLLRVTRMSRELAQVSAIMDAASDMIFVTDDTPLADGGPLITYVNEAMLKEFGYERHELIGLNPSFAFGPRTDPEVTEQIRDAMSTMADAAGEFIVYRRDGTSFWSDWRGREISSRGPSHKRWVAIGRNTHKRRRAEDSLTMLSAAIDNANDAIYVYSIAHNETIPHVRYANPAAVEQSGFTREELEAGARRLGPAAEAVGIEELVKTMRTGRSMRQNLRLYRKDGTSYWAERQSQPIKNRRGEYSQWISIERDVTIHVERSAAMKAERDKLATSQHALVQSEALRSDLMAMIAHDLRNPLTTILGFAELIGDDGLDVPERKGAADQIVSAGRRLESMATELMTFSRLESGSYQPSLEELDVAHLARDVSTYVPGGKRLRIDAPHAVVIVNDPTAIRHVLENLLSNALKFSPASSEVDMSIGIDGDDARIVVIDRGIGIPASELATIFERTTRGSNVGGRRGTGLGLSFVRRLLVIVGGDITVESTEGCGSTFTVRLPLGAGHANGATPLFLV